MTGSSPNRLPDFIIIGAMKAGTTSLYAYLNTHPGISGCLEKEPGYFTEKGWKKSLAWYQSLYPDDDNIKFEASTGYTKYPRFAGVPERMHSVLPKVKLIYVVRHPVERLVSQLHHLIVHEHLSPESDYNSTAFWKEKGAATLDVSRYYLQHQQYLQYYDPSRIHVIRFEDMVSRTAETLNGVLSFLELPDNYFNAQSEFRRFNELSTRARVRHKYLHGKLRAIGRRLHMPFLPRFLETPVSRPVLSTQTQLRIWNQLEEDLLQFQTSLNRDLGYHAPV